MHELAVAQDILQTSLHAAEKAGATQITSIYLVIGELASFVDDSIQYYWQIISVDTIAVHATLNFKRIRAQFGCDHCGTVFALNGESFLCPTCGSTEVHLQCGNEFYIDSIDIDQPSPGNKVRP